MLTVTLTFEDLLDLIPVEGVEVEVDALVVARFRDRITADQLDNELDGVGIALPKEPVEALVPDFERAIVVTRSGSSDAGGEMVVRFQVDDAFRQAAALRREGLEPEDVGALLRLRARVAGVEFEARFFNDVLADGSSNLLPRSGAVRRRVPVDFGKTLIGHVDATSARAFFRFHGELDDADFVCELHEGGAGAGEPLRSLVLRPDTGTANTAVAEFDDLEPGRRYELVVFQRANEDFGIPGAGRRLLSGSFRTDDPSARDIRFVFGSCHNPVAGPGPPPPVLRVWRELETRDDYETLLLLGDQIYGDGIESPVSLESWRDLYLRRYDRFFVYREMREVLRRTPTYMVLDDHEVVDDFGVLPVAELVDPANESDGRQRLGGALEAYEVWQKSHGPRGAGNIEDRKYVDFRRGPAAFFLLDNRTERAADPGSSADPLLGGRQKVDLVAWADRVLESDVDLVFVAAPVPVAFLPVEVVRDLVDDLQAAGTAAGFIDGLLVGAAVGTVAGGPLVAGVGATIGAAYGYYEARSTIHEEGLGDLTTLDLADMWTFAPNQKDLVFLLDLLFDIANDIRSDGTRGNRPRAVFLLGGDVHMGALHLLRSTRPRHGRNPFVFQAISSPLSNRPLTSSVLRTVIEKISNEADVSVLHLLDAPSVDELLERTFGEVGNAAFVLDDQHDANYAAEFLGILQQRNYGHVAITRAPGRRVYRCEFTIQGEDAIGSEFILDLDARQVTPTRDHASFVRQSVPREIRPGRTVRVTVTMRNDGTVPWDGRYQLRSLTSDWLIDKVPLPSRRVDPGEEATFDFRIAALSVGEFTFQWRMTKSFVGDFGPATPRARVTADTGQTGDAACREIRAQIRQTRAEKAALQASFHSASPSEKVRLAAQVQTTQARLEALEKRSRRLGCS